MVYHSTAPQGHDVETVIPYHPLEGFGTEYVAGSVGQYRRKWNYVPTTVHDVRGAKETFHLDKQGFQLLPHKSAEMKYDDNERIKSVVYAEAEQLIKKASGASSVKAVTHLVRRQPPEVARKVAANKDLGDFEPAKVLVPSPGVHIDQSETGAVEFFRDNVSAEEYERLKNHRWAIINMWKPIKTVQRDPLVYCDYRSLDEKDLVPTPVRLPEKGTGTFDAVSRGKGFELYECKPSPRHQWYYTSAMRADEALTLKIFDSKKTPGLARRVPHTSVTVPGTENKETRESIEVRCLAFFENEPLE